jgi:molybdenum cofactor sulfurtransferase
MDCFRDLEAASSLDDDSADGKARPSKAEGFWFGYHRDSHTSIVGVREATDNHHRCFKNDAEVEKWLSDAADGVDETEPSGEGRLGLFAYPGQSNMTGRRLPLSWPGRLRQSPHPAHRNTYTLLDAAALAATAPLDLSDADAAPDFTVLSFYKIFGFPDLGALIIRRQSGHILQWRKYFGGGTVDMVVCIKDAWHSKKATSMHDQLEDGTLPFHNIAALGMALEVHRRLFGSMESVSRHTAYLGKKMYEGLSALQHTNGRPVCRIYKEDNATYGDSKTQGATIAFNIQNAKGELVIYTEVERLADARDIYLRAGGLCNPGGVATYLGFAPWQMKRSFSAGHRCGNETEGTEIVSGKPTGMVRASLGAMTTMADVTTFLEFVGEIFVEKQQLGTPLLHVTPVLRKPKTPQYQIECLRVYPIKGCGGYNIPPGVAWEVGAKGLYLDREWCIVHLDTGTALSRKRYPKMAKIRPSIDLEKGVLTISAPHNEQPELKISLSWSSLEGGDGSHSHRRGSMSNSNFRASAAKVCGDPIPAYPHTSPHIVEFFSAAVGARCTLARFSASNTSSTKGLEARHTKAYLRRSYSSNAVSTLTSNKATNRAPTLRSRTSSTSTAVDTPQVVSRPVLLPSESPVSVITRTSLEWHNEQVKSTRAKVAQPELFRANIVLSEVQPADSRGKKIPAAVGQANIEDNWAFVRIGNLSFEVCGLPLSPSPN